MIYDVSMPISESMQVYKEKDGKRPVFETVADHPNDGAHETNITMNMHTGTHIDYPLHMIENGDTSDKENLATLIGTARVMDFTDKNGPITKNDLAECDIYADDFIILKTKNSFSENFLFDFAYLETSGATYLKEKKIRGVATDGLGIERDQPNHDTHKTLLENDILIIEGLRLKNVPAGNYHMVCLPLAIPGVEATPARMVLSDGPIG